MFKNIISLTLLFTVVFFFTSCTLVTINENNRNIQKLKVGMSKEEVLELMGKPVENEVYSSDSDDVWYYFTESKWSDGRLTRDECTPLFFEKDQLLGWGYKEYNAYKQRYW